MKVFKVVALILVLILAMMAPAFAESGSAEATEDQQRLQDDGEEGEGVDGSSGDLIDEAYRTELHKNTDEFLFSDEIQARLAEDGVKVVYTGPIDENTVNIGVYPDEAASREVVLSLLVQNNIGTEANFEIVHSEEVNILPISINEPGDPAPDESIDLDNPMSDEEREAQAGDAEGNENDMDEEDYVRPDDENAEIGITSVDNLEGDGEESNNNYILPLAAVLGLVAIGGGVLYFKR